MIVFYNSSLLVPLPKSGMTASIRRSLATGTLLAMVLSQGSVQELINSIVPTVETAEAYTVHTTSFSGQSGPFLQNAGGSFQNPGGHWRGLNHPDQGNNPTLLASGLVSGAKIFGNVSGSISRGGGHNPSCATGEYWDDSIVPKLIAIGQFTNDANIVVSIGGGINGTNSFYLRDLAGGITVPAGATRLWVSFPDSDYSDNGGTCQVSLNNNPIGFLDIANCNGVEGWAYDQDVGAGPIQVHMYADGNIIGAATANGDRIDLQPVVGSRNHGYHFDIPNSLKDGQVHNITVYGINVGSGTGNPALSGTPKPIQCNPTTPPANCNDINYIKQQITAGRIRFDRSWDNHGFLVWNETTCSVPVTKANFVINGNLNNQSLHSMQSDVIPAGAFQHGILMNFPTNVCQWGQNDLAFGTYTALPQGTSLAAFNNTVNWTVNGLSAYVFGAACASSSSSVPVAQCSDGLDNDGDGAADYPNDFSCSSPTDTDETNPKSQCQDGIDNDGDGRTDFPSDSGCTSSQDNDEFNVSTACSSLIYNAAAGSFSQQGWTLVGGGPNATISHPQTDSTGVRYVVMEDNTFSNVVGLSQLLSASAMQDRDWSARILSRVRGSYYRQDSDLGVNMLIASDGQRYASLYQSETKIGNASTATNPASYARSVSYPTTNGFHLYEIRYHKNGSGVADDTYDIVVDGQVRIPNIPRNENYIPGSNEIGATPSLFFGLGSTGGIGTFDVASVTFNNTDNSCPRIPQCADGSDNDGDGFIDSVDPACHTDGNPNNPNSYDPRLDPESRTFGQCDDRFDNDNDGVSDAADSDCHTDGNASNLASYDPRRPENGQSGTPNLRIQKVPLQTTISRGGQAFYRITVTNVGTALAQNVVVTDQITGIAGGTVTFNPSLSSPACVSYNGSLPSVYGPPPYSTPNFPVSQNAVCFLSNLSPNQSVSVLVAFNVGSGSDQCSIGSTASVINSAQVRSNGVVLDSVNAQSVAVQCNSNGNPNLNIQKSANQFSVNRGGIASYSIVVSNTGQGAAQNVIITDPIPSLQNGTVTFNPSYSSSVCAVQGANVVCTVPSLAAAQTLQLTVAFNVGSTVDSCTLGSSVNLTNTANVRANNFTTPVGSTAQPVQTVCTTNGTPSLALTKTPLQTSISRGGNVQYRLRVTNNGTSVAQNVVIADPVPTIQNGTVTYLPGSSSSQCSLVGSSVNCNIGALNAGAFAEVTLTFQVGSTTDQCSQGSQVGLSNTATVSATGVPALPPVTSQSVSVQCVTNGNTTLQITSSASPTTVNRGSPVTYTVTVTNAGTVAAQNVIVVDPAPTLNNGTVVFNASGSSSQCGLLGNGQVQCSAGTLAPGQSAQFNIAFVPGTTTDSCTQGTTSNLTNTPTAQASNAAQVSTSTNVSVTCVTGTPLLGITKTPTQSSITRGGVISYIIHVSNNGTAAAQNVLVTDSVPSISNGTVTFNSAGSSSQCSLVGGNQVQCSLPSLAAGLSADFTVAFTVGAQSDSCGGNTATLNNSASVTATGMGTQSANAQGVSVQCPASGTPNVTIQKTTTSSTVQRGSTIVYNISVSNIGTAAATNVVITDPIPSLTNGTVTFSPSGSNSNCSLQSGNVVCSVGTLNSNQTNQYAIAFVVGSSSDACGGNSATLNNSASVSGTGFSTQQSTAQGVTVQCTSTGNGNLQFQKIANQSNVNRGGIVTYSLNVSNNGTGPLQNVIITDPIPSLSLGSVTFNSSVSNSLCSAQGLNVVCNVGTLNAGQTAQLTVGFTVGSVSDPCSSGSTATLNNSATASATGQSSVTSQASGVNVQCQVATGGLQIAITDNLSTINAGSVDTYQITVTNPSSAQQTGVTVTSTLSNLVTFLNANENGFVSGQTVTWSNVTVPGNGQKIFTVQVQVPSSVANGSYIYTSAQVAGGNSANDSTTVQNGGGTGNGNIIISVTDDPDPVDPCEEVTYSIRLTNTSSQNASNISVDQYFNSSDLTFVSAGNGGYQNGNGVRWNNISINAGGQITLTSRARVSCDADDGQTLRGSVSTTNFSIDFTTRVSDDGNGGSGDVSINVTGDPDEVEVGDTIEYTIRVTNDSNSTRTVNVTAELDSDTSFLNASGNGDDINDDEVIWRNLRLNRDETRTLRLEVRVRNTADDGQSLRLEARVPGDSDTETTRVGDNGGGSSNNGGGGSTTSNISVTKSADRFEANPGDVITYTVKLRNLSSKIARGLQVSDSFPYGMLQVVESGGGSPTSGGITWNVDLAANQERTLVYRARISSTARPGDAVHNSVYVSGTNVSGGSASADVRILGYILPQTGAGDFTKPLEDRTRFLFSNPIAPSEGGMGGILALMGSAIASVAGGFLLRRRFF